MKTSLKTDQCQCVCFTILLVQRRCKKESNEERRSRRKEEGGKKEIFYFGKNDFSIVLYLDKSNRVFAFSFFKENSVIWYLLVFNNLKYSIQSVTFKQSIKKKKILCENDGNSCVSTKTTSPWYVVNVIIIHCYFPLLFLFCNLILLLCDQMRGKTTTAKCLLKRNISCYSRNTRL